MAPASKKRKIEAVERYHCSSCATDRISRQFPDYNPSPDCDHLINTCKTCLKKWTDANVSAANFAKSGEDGKGFGVKCPECDGIMRNVNIEIAATKKMYERFEKLERKHIGDSIRGWRWCLSPHCPAGQVHEKKVENEPPAKRPKRRTKTPKPDPETDTTPPQEPDICTCSTCGAKACVACDRPWHEGETCEAYQARTKDHIVEENESLKEIYKVTKQCPNCLKKIQRNGGCPSMICSQCQTNFCWNCATKFDYGYCKCRPRPVGFAAVGGEDRLGSE